MCACMTPVGFDTSDKFENHCLKGSVYFAVHSAILLRGESIGKIASRSILPEVGEVDVDFSCYRQNRPKNYFAVSIKIDAAFLK